MTLNASRKGKRGERRVVNAYQALDGWDASRASGVLEAMHEAPTGVDVRAWADGLRLAIQVRTQARPNVFQALADATAGACFGEIPLAHIKRTHPGALHTERIVVLAEDVWLALLATWSGSASRGVLDAEAAQGLGSGRPDLSPQQRG